MTDIYKSTTSDVVYPLTSGHQRVADIYKSITSDVFSPLTFGHQRVADIYKSVTCPWHQLLPIQHLEIWNENISAWHIMQFKTL